MTSRDFCFWLQGFFEIAGQKSSPEAPEIGREQALIIERHLALVFKHEIDPAMGGPAHQAVLSEAHKPPTPASPYGPPSSVRRC